jgi:GT2 family glycosyltransferase
MAAVPPTSVVVCAYTLERWDVLVDAVRGAAAQQPAPDEVVLVVDHNPELAQRAREELARASSDDGAGPGGSAPITVVENRHGRGLSGARNTGIESTSTEIVAFLDDDAVPAEGWLSALIAPFADPAVAATGGRAQPVWSPHRPAWFPEELDWVVGCSYIGQPPSLAEVRNPLGCNMAFRRRALDAVGGFREGLGRVGKHPLGCEETELCIRLRQADPSARIVVDPTSVVHHHVTPDRHRFEYFRRRCFAEGISKAAVTGQVGTTDGLSSERTYVTRTLPRGVAGGLVAAVRDRDPDPARRAGAIVAGLCFTVAGYVRGRIAGTPAVAAAPGVPASAVGATVGGDP